jgi:hypothetical protein
MGILGFQATPIKMGRKRRNEREMRKEIRTATHGTQREEGRASPTRPTEEAVGKKRGDIAKIVSESVMR